MEATDVLMQEHRTIEQVLDALEAFAGELVRARRTEKDELGRFVTFIREFADARHHAKEEGVLFEAMVEQGFPREGGPIPVMLHEHAQGRALVGILASHATQEPAWSEEDLGSIAEAALQFAALLRHHIQKEDRILYPMAERHLSEAAAAQVDEACRRLDAAQGPAARDPHLALAELLCAAHPAEPRRVA
jgi:hemerythrin-like domain-containing protein